MAECIHGLELGLCDLCFPKARPETTARRPTTSRGGSTVRSAGAARGSVGAASGSVGAASGSAGAAGSSASRTTPRGPGQSPGASSRSTVGARGGASSAISSFATIDVGAQRIYHVTHLRNLASIAAAGALTADAHPEVDVSSSLTRELRRSAELPGGLSAADSVAFYLSPDATLWRDIRSGARGAHWSDAARRSSATDFIVLVATVGALTSPVLADADAAQSLTRFAVEIADQQRMLRRLHSDGDAVLDAEVLAPGSVLLDVITLVGVANTRARDEVKAIFASSPSTPKVAMYPPWFAADA